MLMRVWLQPVSGKQLTTIPDSTGLFAEASHKGSSGVGRDECNATKKRTHTRELAEHWLHQEDIGEQGKNALGRTALQKKSLAGEHAHWLTGNKPGKYDPACGRHCKLLLKATCMQAACDRKSRT